MSIFPFKKKNIEKEIEFLYDNELELVKKLNNAKTDLLVYRSVNLILCVLFAGYFVYNMFYVESLGCEDRFPVLYWVLILLIVVSRADDGDVRFLSTIHFLKRKMEQGKSDSTDN